MATTTKTGTFSAEEKAAMRQRAKEAKENATKEENLKAVQDAIAAMTDADRAIAERVHALVTAAAPELDPKTYYGMPAYARDGKVVVFFKNSAKFKERYCTLGFEGAATLDDGGMWPTAYAITTLTKADEERITALVKQASS